jgi:hypothetical protein
VVLYTMEPTQSSGFSNLYMPVTICDETYTCIRVRTVEDDPLPARQNLNQVMSGCPFGMTPVHSTICTEVMVYIPSSGGGSDDGPGGDPGSGGGGSGPPDCPTGTGRNNLTDDPCGPGWIPTIDPPSANQIIIDSLQGYPCAQNILAQLPSINSQITKLLDSVFFINENTELYFKPKLNFTKDSMDAYTGIPSGSASFFRSTIFMNPWMMTNSTKEYIAATFIHESIHAYINFWYFQYRVNHVIDSNQFKQMFPIFWDYYRNDGFHYQPSQSHNEMAERYVTMMKDFIRTFSPGMSETMVNAIAWGGLEKTNVWRTLSDTGSINNLNRIARQDQDSSTNNTYINYNLRKCN